MSVSVPLLLPGWSDQWCTTARGKWARRTSRAWLLRSSAVAPAGAHRAGPMTTAGRIHPGEVVPGAVRAHLDDVHDHLVGAPAQLGELGGRGGTATVLREPGAEHVGDVDDGGLF